MMSGILENIYLACAVCKIGIYTLFRRICCKAPPPPRPEFSPICIGLMDAGKTTLLSQICGHDLRDITPTKGFEIKACQFKNCILNIKEIGGGHKIRPFWKRYFEGANGVIFVVNSSCSDAEMAETCEALHTALEDPALYGQPCLVIGNYQDITGARNAKQLEEALDLLTVSETRKLSLRLCHKDDIKAIKEAFEEFITFLLSDGDEEPEKQADINRI